MKKQNRTNNYRRMPSTAFSYLFRIPYPAHRFYKYHIKFHRCKENWNESIVRQNRIFRTPHEQRVGQMRSYLLHSGVNDRGFRYGVLRP